MEHGKPFFTVACDIDLVPVGFERFPEKTGRTRIVFKVKDADRFGFGHGSLSRAVILMETVCRRKGAPTTVEGRFDAYPDE
jgi:hypothetical protein